MNRDQCRQAPIGGDVTPLDTTPAESTFIWER